MIIINWKLRKINTIKLNRVKYVFDIIKVIKKISIIAKLPIAIYILAGEIAE